MSTIRIDLVRLGDALDTHSTLHRPRGWRPRVHHPPSIRIHAASERHILAAKPGRIILISEPAKGASW